MSTTILYIYASVAGVTAISLIGVITLAVSEIQLRRILPYLIALSAGGLLGGAIFHLIPEAVERISPMASIGTIVAGIAGFFILERFFHWHHHHQTHISEEGCRGCDVEIRPYGRLILVADVLHNTLDGVIIAAAFLLSIETGIIATIAVALHEIPQEIGDFGVLLQSGFSRLGALFANVLSGLSAFVGAALTIFFAGVVETLVPFLTAAAAGGFLYIAFVDLIPEMHRSANNGIGVFFRALVLLFGLFAIAALGIFE